MMKILHSTRAYEIFAPKQSSDGWSSQGERFMHKTTVLFSRFRLGACLKGWWHLLKLVILAYVQKAGGEPVLFIRAFGIEKNDDPMFANAPRWRAYIRASYGQVPEGFVLVGAKEDG